MLTLPMGACDGLPMPEKPIKKRRFGFDMTADDHLTLEKGMALSGIGSKADFTRYCWREALSSLSARAPRAPKTVTGEGGGDQVEKIRVAMAKHSGNVSAAAIECGLSRRSVTRISKAHGFHPSDSKL
jgi:hypothetical protein